jgi:outer membrane receptor protein involved in Fe transport
VSAVQDTYRSEYAIMKLGAGPVAPVTLTLSKTQEIALEVVSPLAPIQYKASSETYALSRKEIEALPRGNNNELHDVLLTIPSAVYGSLKQVHIRQDHANLQLRIDGVPIPDTVSSTFSDVISPRAWERADIILGGMEAQYGNKAAAVLDITTKSGTKPSFGSVQMMGGSNKTINPSFEYGGTIGEKFRFYILNSHTATNRGIEPPTLGRSVYHGQSERNQTFIRGDYQHDNRNNFTWLFLNSVAKYQIPTAPGGELDPSGQMLPLLQGSRPGFSPVASQAIDEFQKENNQYGHMVWRHDVNANNFFSLSGYMRHTRATFKTDPLNLLAYTADPAEPFSASDQDRNAYSTGVRFDYTYVHSKQHLIKAGFQLDRTQSVNKTRLFTFLDDGAGNPTGDLLSLNADNRQIGYRQEFWIQDQWSPNDQWTFNLGLRGDIVQYQRNEGQVSPRIGVSYKYNPSNVFHVFYGRMFTPPNLEAISFAKLNTLGTRAQPEDVTNNTVRAERAHYFEVGSYHALNRYATLQFTGWYKLSNFLSDAGQFGTTPVAELFCVRARLAAGHRRGLETATDRESHGARQRGLGTVQGVRIAVRSFPPGGQGDCGHQFAGRGVLRSYADPDEFGDCELPAAGAHDVYGADVVCLRVAHFGERGRQDELQPQPVLHDLQSFDCACVPVAMGRAEVPARLRYRQPVRSAVLHQSGRGEYRVGSVARGDADGRFSSAASGSFDRMLKRATSIVLGLHESSTYPEGTPPVRPSPAALLDGSFEHPLSAEKYVPAAFSVSRLPATYRKGTPQSPSSLRPCWTTLLGICLRLGEHTALLDGLLVQLAQKYRTV